MSKPFVHTHVHSDYSLLEGTAKVADLVAAAVADEQPALALTDHGNLCGAIEFYTRCRKAGVKPLVGTEVYVAPHSRHDRERNPVSGFNLILLAQNEAGYRNLIKLSTRSFTEGFYYVPRVDKELLSSLGADLIATSADLWGEPGYYARHDETDRARRAAEEMRDIFEDRYYLEIQRNGREGQKRVNAQVVEIAAATGIPLVASQDVHYVHREDAEAHHVHRCIGMGKLLSDDALRRPGELEFRSKAQMYAAFADLEHAVARSAEVADRCDLELELGQLHLPRFTPPDGQDEYAYFQHLCEVGARRVYGDPLPEAARKRLTYEQGVIKQMGFVAYFLITWDFVRFAKEHAIPVGPGRGSAAGSIVSYVLDITTVDPLKYDLLFERFLNPARISMPDIDIDFCKDGRERVIRYVQEKYGGKDCVSQIITFGRMKARAVIRDVGRVLDVSLRDVDILAKKVPNGPGATLRGALEADPDLKQLIEGNDEYKRLIELALRLEGMNRNAGKHAAGVVVSDGPLEQFVPLYKVGDELATQYTMDHLEDIGLLKMDFLGLRTLTIIDKTLENIRRGGRVPPDMLTLPLDDEETYRMLARGDALGVFQVESSGMRDVMRKIRPNCFDDLATIVALYRPGPMGSGMMDMYIERKNGREEVTYPHPSLKPLLEETQGVVVYQEQVMRITNVLAGFSLPDADLLRKAMGKKKRELLEQFRGQFVEGCGKNGMAAEQATEIWNQLEHFAGYGFNKSHTIAYGLITYQTAYLKRHMSREFMAALLTCEMSDMDKLTQYIEEARCMGIDVLPPDMNTSDWEFTVEGENVRYGLAAIKGVGRAAADAIVAGRATGPYTNLFDLCEQVDQGRVNRATLEALIRAGAVDCSGAGGARVRRAQLMAVLDRALALGSAASADRSAGQLGLFSEQRASAAPPDYPDLPEWPDAELLASERESIGYYATDHPLREHERLLRLLAGCRSTDLADMNERTIVRLGGLIRESRTSVVRSGRNEGRRMGFFVLEDFHGTVECVLFARTFAECGHLMVSDRIVLIEAKVDLSREVPNLHVNRIVPIEEAPRQLAEGVLIRLDQVVPPVLDQIRRTVANRSGPLPLVLEFAADPETLARVKAGPGWSVEATEDLLDSLAAVPHVETAEFLARAP